MRPSQIENWALQVIERVELKQPIEDSRVELKSTWIDPKKGARRLAGHLNAARGEPILWLVGVDEDKGVLGVEREELTEWVNKIHALFEGIKPTLQDITIAHNEKIFLALLFESDRAPYVIKVPEFGEMKGLPSHEVPWREGTEVRSARRSDLIKILVPVVHKPEIELLDGEMMLYDHQEILLWVYTLQIYVTPEMGTSFSVPFHKCSISFDVEGKVPLTSMNNLRIRPPYKHTSGGSLFASEPDSNTIIHTNEDILITGPGRMNITARYEINSLDYPKAEEFVNSKLKVFIQLLPTYVENDIHLETNMEWRNKEPTADKNLTGYWKITN